MRLHANNHSVGRRTCGTDKMARHLAFLSSVTAWLARCAGVLRRWSHAAWTSALLLAVAMVTMAQGAAPDGTVVPIRTGSHPGYGRIVFDAPEKARYTLTRDGDTVVVRFEDDFRLDIQQPSPRNVTRLITAAATATFSVNAGATLRQTRLGNRVVIDIVDPPTSQASQPTVSRQPAADPRPAAPQPEARSPQQISGQNSIQRITPPPNLARTAVPPANPSQTTRADTSTPVRPQPDTGLGSPPAETPTQATARSAATQLPVRPTGPNRAVSPPIAPATAASVVPSETTLSAPEQQRPGSGTGTESMGPAIATAPVVAVSRDPTVVAMLAIQAPEASAGPAEPAIQPLATTVPRAPTNGPIALVVRRTASVPGLEGPGFLVPFPSSVGAALFRRGSAIWVVFDERRLLDLTALRGEPTFAGASTQLVSGGAVIRVPLAEGKTVTVSRSPQAWKIALALTPQDPAAIVPVVAEGRMTFPVESASDVITLADPQSGSTLLVGTQRKANQAIVTGRRTTEFSLIPTQLGVVVEPLSDILSLRTIPTGFLLTGGAQGLMLSSPAFMTDALLAAARLTRRFQFPALPTEALLQRMQYQVREAAVAAPLARGPKRRSAAETMIAAGLGAEAMALLEVAAGQDPHEAASADFKGLYAIAAILANRLDQANGINDPRLSGIDEIAFWRGILLANQQEGTPQAASLLASTAPLAFTYPAAVRDKVLPLALETLILGGEVNAAARMLGQRETDPTLGLAQALLKQAQGDTDKALEQLDALAAGRDRLARARAAVRAVELRLASQRIDNDKAVEALDKLLYVWRGDQRDLALRLRIAELRRQTGGWREALKLLRNAKADFPPHTTQIQSRMRDMFSTLIHEDGAASMTPLDFIALVEENADLLPPGTEDTALENRLAERLLALDLPKRADQVLAKLMKAAPTPRGRAGLGVRLAELRLREDDPAGAVAALSASSMPNLDADLLEARALIGADATSRLGDTPTAMEMLSELRSPAALAAKAGILERAQDWPAAKQALIALVGLTVPATGDLDDQQKRTLLRLATAAARAGDDSALANLGAREDPRMGSGPVADMFRLLTADPVRGVGDLKRAKQEIGLVRALPAGLKALQAQTATQ